MKNKKKQVEIDKENGWKICRKCNQKKGLDKFYQIKKRYLYGECKQCKDEKSKKRQAIHQPEYRKRNMEKIKHYNKMYYQKNRDKFLEYKRLRSKDEQLKKRLNEYKRKWHQKRKKECPNYRLRINLSSRVRSLLKSRKSKKNSSILELIGCEMNFLKQYLESLWKNGMSWSNYGYGEGKWVIDHIIPCRSFNLINKEEQLKCFHYSNLQPLWFGENRKKHDFLPDGTRARDLNFNYPTVSIS